ncbi:hypothetical protein YC2023_070730 [Brassica napus]
MVRLEVRFIITMIQFSEVECVKPCALLLGLREWLSRFGDEHGLASRRWSHCLNPTFTVSKPLSPASGPSMWNLRFTSDDATGCV